MNTFLAETVIGGQFHLNRHDLADRRNRQGTAVGPPGDQQTASADVFGGHRVAQPQRWRRHMAPELDLNSRALAPVYVSHFRGFDIGDFSARSSAVSIS